MGLEFARGVSAGVVACDVVGRCVWVHGVSFVLVIVFLIASV